MSGAVIRGLAALALCAASSPGAAVTIAVTTTADDVAVNGNCTLREAISAAANDLAYDACPAGSPADVDAVEVPAGDYAWNGTLDVPAGRTWIHGPAGAAPAVHLALGSSGRFLRIYNHAEVTLESFELVGGSAALDGSNPHGGQISCDGADLTLRDVRLLGGGAQGGGAVFFRGAAGDALRIEGTRFDSNGALSAASGLVMGGALEVHLLGGGEARILDSEFLHAGATGTAPFAWPQGGAIFLDTVSGDTVEIARSRFDDDRVTAFAGGQATGGAVELHLIAATDVALRDLVFTNNHVAQPATGFRVAALDLDAQQGSSAILDRMTLLGNGEGEPGAHLRLGPHDTSAIVATNLLLARGPDTGVEAVAQDDSSILLGHLTVGAHPSIGVHLVALQNGALRLDNSLAWGSAIDLWDTVPSSIDPSTLPQGTDPRFVDPANDDYRLAAGSPAIDFGDDALATVRSFDAAHASRRLGPATDAGAREYDGVFADDFESGGTAAWAIRLP